MIYSFSKPELQNKKKSRGEMPKGGYIVTTCLQRQGLSFTGTSGR